MSFSTQFVPLIDLFTFWCYLPTNLKWFFMVFVEFRSHWTQCDAVRTLAWLCMLAVTAYLTPSEGGTSVFCFCFVLFVCLLVCLFVFCCFVLFFRQNYRKGCSLDYLHGFSYFFCFSFGAATQWAARKNYRGGGNCRLKMSVKVQQKSKNHTLHIIVLLICLPLFGK